MKKTAPKKEPVKKQDNRKERKKSVQSAIPYDEFYDNGLLLTSDNTYSLVCELSDVGYLSRPENEQNRKYETYKAMINQLPSNIHYQELIYTLPTDTEQYINAIASKENDYANEYEQTFFDIERKFISEIARENNRKKYLVSFSFRNEHGENPYDILYDVYVMLQDKFREIGSTVTLLTPNEVFAHLFHVYNPFAGTMPLLPSDLYRRGLSVRDIISPDGIEYKQGYFMLGNTYCRVLSITSYGSEIVDTLIHTLTSQNAMIFVSKHLEHEPKEAAIKSVTKQLRELESRRPENRLGYDSKRGTGHISIEHRQAIEGCNQILESLYGNEEFFRMTVYVMITARSLEELEQLTVIAQGRALTVHCTLKAVTVEQYKALNSVLPLGRDYMKRHQFMMSSEAAVATPFSYETYFDLNGFFYGFNDRSGVPAIINRKLDKSSNGFVFGVTGSGKSIFVKHEISNVMYQPFCRNDDVMIIDPTGEYLPIADAFGGEIISVKASSDTRINPLHVSNSQIEIRGKDAAIASKTDFLIAFLSQIKDSEPLTAAEKSLTDTICTDLYRKKKDPTLMDFYRALGKSGNDLGNQMMTWLKRYIEGSITLFAGNNNISSSNRLTVFDLRDLTGDLKNIGMLAMLSMIEDKVMENNAAGKWTWIYVDEFHRYFDEERNPYAAEKFSRMFSELRKFGAIITGITQLPRPVARSKAGETMLSNSSFIVSAELDARNIETLIPICKLNEDQQRTLASPQVGQYVLRSKGVTTQIKLLYPGKKPDEKNALFDLFNTDFKDRAIV